MLPTALYKCVSSSTILTYLQGALSPRVERVRLLRVQGKEGEGEG